MAFLLTAGFITKQQPVLEAVAFPAFFRGTGTAEPLSMLGTRLRFLYAHEAGPETPGMDAKLSGKRKGART